MGLKPQGFKGGEVKEVSKVNASLLLLCLFSLNYLDRVFNALVIKVPPPGETPNIWPHLLQLWSQELYTNMRMLFRCVLVVSGSQAMRKQTFEENTAPLCSTKHALASPLMTKYLYFICSLFWSFYVDVV